jgi:hypothetical protein
MEILKAINRNSTDNDKVAMPIVRNLSVLIRKAKSAKVVEQEKVEVKPSLATAPPPPQQVKEELPALPPTAAPTPKPLASEAQAAVVSPVVAPTEVKVESKPIVVEKPPTSFLVLTKGGNIRSEPSAKSKIITTLKKGDKVEKLDKSGNWFKIKLASGDTGWVFKDLVKEAE